MHFECVYWLPSAGVVMREFDAGEDWRDVLGQGCPRSAALAKIV